MKTLSRRILSLFLPLIIIPALLSGFFALAAVPYFFSREFNKNLETSLTGWQMEFKSLEKQLIQLGSLVRDDPEILEALEGEDRQFLLQYLTELIRRNRLDGAEFLDPDGYVIAEAHRPARFGHFEGDRPSFKALNGDSLISGLEITDQGVGIVLKMELLKEGSRVGVLELSLQLNLAMLQNMKEKYGLDSIIYNGNLLQATTLTDPIALGSYKLETISREVLATGQSYLTTETLNGEPYYIIGERIGLGTENPAFLFLLQSSASVSFIIRISLIFYTITIVIIILLSLLLTGQMTSRIVGPLTRLSRMSKDVSEGKFGLSVPLEGDEEIRSLADTFNFMNSSLKVMVEGLEEQVTERTAHLQKVNDQLSLEVIERTRAEEETSAMRENLVEILDSMPSVLIGVDRDGLVTDANKMAVEFIGSPINTAREVHYKTLLPQLADVLEKGFSEVESDKSFTAPAVLFLKGDEETYLDLTVYAIDTAREERFILRIDDVTEKEKMEEHMVQSEKMLSVGGLAAGMAHEINNPLAGMVQTAGVMVKRLTDMNLSANVKAVEEAGFSMEQLETYLKTRGIVKMMDSIRVSGMRASEIVQDMLDFARKEDKTYSSHNLVEIMETSLNLSRFDYNLKKDYDFKDIEIQKEYEEGDYSVLCESGKIQQVFLNLLKNGAEAMYDFHGPGGKSKFIIRIAEEGSDWIRVEIEDNGPGMDETVRKRIFEPFFTTKPEGVGTGLGLSVSYFIICENHKGKMAVQSRIGNGTRFIIHLPR